MKKIFVVLIFCLFCFCSCNSNKYDFVNEPFTIEYCYKRSEIAYYPLVTVKYDGNDFITHYYSVYPKNFVGASIPHYKIFPEDSVNDEIEHKIEYDTVCYSSDTLKNVRVTRDGGFIEAYRQTEDGHYRKFLDSYFGKN